ncbi:MAG TPA: acyltransferase family protein [Acidobacteriaceae bacterium]
MGDSIPPQERIREDAYRTDIDGLRAIAVTSVVLYHAHLAALSGGFVGVDIFFVISGYLIGAHIYKDVSARRFSLGRFYKKRAKRILPALFFLLLFCYLIALLVLTPLELTSFANYCLSTIFSFSNVVAWQDNSYFAAGADQKPLLMTWSLGIEEQFYIFIPLLMLVLARVGSNARSRLIFWGFSVLALLSFGVSVWGATHALHSTFYLLPSRAWELLAGVLMAIHEAAPAQQSDLYGGRRWSDIRSIAGAAGILFAVLHYGTTTKFPGIAALPPVLGAGLILSAPGAWLNRIVLASRPFRWIGLVSYSWYLWHWPLLSFARISADEDLATSKALLLCAIALGMAWISYLFVEQPFRYSKMPFAPLLRRYAAASVLIAAPAAAMMHTHGFPGRFPLATAQERTLYRTHPCMGKASLVQTEECLPAADGREALALMGDSHADGIAPRMRELADAGNVRLYILARSSCPPLLGVVASTLDINDSAECLAYNHAALKRVADDPAVHTVVLEALWAGPLEYFPRGNGFLRKGQTAPVSREQSNANFRQGLDAMVSALRSAGKRVIILQDEYGLRFDAGRRLISYLIPARGWIRHHMQGEMAVPGLATTDDMYVMENQETADIIAQIAAKQGATTFDLRTNLCSGSSCSFFSAGVPLYLDTNHLSPTGVTLALHGIPLFERTDQSIPK